MCRACYALSLFAAVAIVLPAVAQLPPGYHVVQVTDTLDRESSANVNNTGQIVFQRRQGGDNTTTELFLYDANTGELTQLTDNDVQDCCPDINDAGVIGYSSDIGPNGSSELMIRYPDGTLIQLTDNDTNDTMDAINNLGQVCWHHENLSGCQDNGHDVMFFDGQTIHQLTDNQFYNQSIELNDVGQLIWTEYDICPGGANWRSLIKLYSDGQISTLTEPGLQAQVPSINNSGLCSWMFFDPQAWEGGIVLLENGETTFLTDWGSTPRINNAGDVALIRWHEDTSTHQIWLYRNGEFRQITNGEFKSVGTAMNDLGELVWEYGEVTWADLHYLRRYCDGDLNCDGVLDSEDIDPFFRAIGFPLQYPIEFPRCDVMLADMNSDGSVDAEDVDRFFAELGGGPRQISNHMALPRP